MRPVVRFAVWECRVYSPCASDKELSRSRKTETTGGNEREREREDEQREGAGKREGVPARETETEKHRDWREREREREREFQGVDEGDDEAEGYLFAFGKQRVWAVLYCVCLPLISRNEGRREPIKSLFPPSSLYAFESSEFMLEILISTALHSHAGAF